MTCVVYIPQVQIQSGQWIDVGIPASSLQEADVQKTLFPLTNRLIAFRIMQSSCEEQKISRTCHGCGSSG